MADKHILLEKVKQDLSQLKDEDYHWVLNKAALARPWRPKRKGWVNVMDQFLHAGYAALLLLPILLLNSIQGAVLFGFVAGVIREIEQYFNQDLKIKMIHDRILDVFSFVIGAAAIFMLF